MLLHCPKPFLYDCKCPQYAHIIQTPTLTHYPATGLLVVKGRVYLISRESPRGPHFMLALIKSVESTRYELLCTVRFYKYRFERMISAVCENPNMTREIFSLRVLTSVDGVPIVCFIMRLQRWARTHVPARRLSRRLALAMALHARLGEGSALGRMGADALELVLNA